MKRITIFFAALSSVLALGGCTLAPIAMDTNTESLEKGEASITMNLITPSVRASYGLTDSLDGSVAVEEQFGTLTSGSLKYSFHNEDRAFNTALTAEAFQSNVGSEGFAFGGIVSYRFNKRWDVFSSAKWARVHYNSEFEFDDSDSEDDFFDDIFSIEINSTLTYVQANAGLNLYVNDKFNLFSYFPCFYFIDLDNESINEWACSEVPTVGGSVRF